MLSHNLNKKRIVIYIISILFAFIAMQSLEKNQMMNGECSSAYLSGAVNWSFDDSWKVNYSEMEIFEKLSNRDKLSYRFKEKENIVDYNHNALGLLHITAFARNIFFWQGDLQSIISLQQVIHIVLSMIILMLLRLDYHKILFYILYVVNPLVLYFVDFPYYYFWQVIPSSIWLIYYLYNKKIGHWLYLIAFLFAFIFIVRPSTLFLLLFVLGYFGYREDKIKAIIAFLIFTGGIFFLKPSTESGKMSYIWHTVYIGIGAYPNDYNIEMKDTSGYKVYKNNTGLEYIGGCKENKNKEIYLKLLQEKYFSIFKESPLLLFKNSILNTLQAYGFGYKVNWKNVNYMSAFLGMILIGLLIYFGEYLLFFMIGLASISFSPYFPPIASYMFGSYLLIIFAWLVIVTKIFTKMKKGKSR